MYGKHPTRFASPDGGSDPIVSESTDGLIRTQCIHNPIWSGLTNGKGVAGRYDQLPNQYVPLHEECPVFWQEVLRYWMSFLKVSFVSKITTRNFASLTTFMGVFPRRMLGSGKKTYCWWKWIQTVLEVENLKPFSVTHFWTLFTHSCIALSTLFNVFPLTQSKVVHKQGAVSTL